MPQPLASEFYKQMLDHLAEGVYFVDAERRVLYWNRAAEEITGYRGEELVGRFCYDNILDHVDGEMCSLCKGECPLDRCMRTGEPIETRVFLARKQGDRIPVAVKVVPIKGEKGEVLGAVEVFSDATDTVEIEQLNEDLQRLIRIDPLTQVPNRRAMMEALEREHQRFRRYGTPFSLVFVDIDHFKRVNDTFGHMAGDKALQWMVRQLVENLRRADLVGRFGGEEFIVLLSATKLEAAGRMAEHIRSRLAEGTCPATGEVLTASFGVATMCPEDTVESLLARADSALYRSKDQGRNRVTLAVAEGGE